MTWGAVKEALLSVLRVTFYLNLISIFKLLFNLTERELNLWTRRCPYLTKTGRGNFFNPFDLGFKNNINEAILPLIEEN